METILSLHLDRELHNMVHLVMLTMVMTGGVICKTMK